MQDKGRGVKAGVDLLRGGALAVAILLGVKRDKLVSVDEAAHRELRERGVQGGFAAYGQELRGVLAKCKFEGKSCGFQLVGVDSNKDAVGVLRAAGDSDVRRLGRGFYK